jgi:hypothetical protein
VCHLHFTSAAWRPCLERLLASSRPASWRTLDLSSWREGASLAQMLATAASLSRLRSLALRSAELGDTGAIALAGSPHLASLVALELVGNNITDHGVRALLDSPYFATLRQLELGWGNRLSPAILEEVRTRFR